MEKNTLRKKIEDTKAEYTKRYGRLDWRYTDEGLPWAIQDYHGSVGSVMDFTEDDWLACKENGWTLDEVCKLCNERRFCEDVDNLELYIQAVRNDDSEAGINNECLELCREDALALVEDFYKWRQELFPKVLAVYESNK